MIRPLSEANIPEAGGKARGLARLMDMQVNVPDGVVLIPRAGEAWKPELESYLSKHSMGPVAVRSSALAEDGERASFAGQFESVLNCSGPDEIVAATEKCMQSAVKERVGSYTGHFNVDQGSVFPVLIQKMVPAVRSGVIFTANPVNNRTDQWMINVTSGVGEALMGGTAEGEQILITRGGNILEKGILLDEKQIEEIYLGARSITRSFGRPMDLEWAIDPNGELFWLQARPITTLKKVHINELDSELCVDNEVLTRANIGEMMPGPVTPLTFSVFGRAIEVGLQDFYVSCGALKDFTDEWVYFRMFYNHIFFSLTRLVDISGAVLMNKKANVEFAIMGDMLGDRFGDYRPIKPKFFPLRLWNQIRQFRYLSAGVKRTKKLELLADTFSVKENKDPVELYHEICKSLPLVNEAYAHHYCASSQSGTYQSVLMAILSGGSDKPDIANYRDAAFLMSDLEDVESADVVKSIDLLYEWYSGDEEVMEWISSVSKESRSPRIFEFQEHMDDLLAKHGHRCVREGELREKSWSEEPEKLYNLIRKRFQAGDRLEADRTSYEEHRDRILSGMSGVKGKILSRVLKPARAAVARREFTKSMAVKVQQKVKKAYLRLAELLVDRGLLGDVDQVFFLSHEELGSLLESGESSWQELAEERRAIFPDSFALKFEVVNQGYPEPLSEDTRVTRISGDAVKGLPVSAGLIEARIRIVEKLEDADTLEKGEIMVCQYTDVGWTPYFSLASGLITEIGSPLSHGAVVAREYGIPAVVNAKGALAFFKNGEKVSLDGATGVIKKIS